MQGGGRAARVWGVVFEPLDAEFAEGGVIFRLPVVAEIVGPAFADFGVFFPPAEAVDEVAPAGGGVASEAVGGADDVGIAEEIDPAVGFGIFSEDDEPAVAPGRVGGEHFPPLGEAGDDDGRVGVVRREPGFVPIIVEGADVPAEDHADEEDQDDAAGRTEGSLKGPDDGRVRGFLLQEPVPESGGDESTPPGDADPGEVFEVKEDAERDVEKDEGQYEKRADPGEKEGTEGHDGADPLEPVGGEAEKLEHGEGLFTQPLAGIGDEEIEIEGEVNGGVVGVPDGVVFEDDGEKVHHEQLGDETKAGQAELVGVCLRRFFPPGTPGIQRPGSPEWKPHPPEKENADQDIAAVKDEVVAVLQTHDEEPGGNDGEAAAPTQQKGGGRDEGQGKEEADPEIRVDPEVGRVFPICQGTGCNVIIDDSAVCIVLGEVKQPHQQVTKDDEGDHHSENRETAAVQEEWTEKEMAIEGHAFKLRLIE